jgi:D-alanine-D-alanine ligase
MKKIRVGILMGGISREREISFAGGRTVYDNLNRAIFEPIPILVDSLGNFYLLNWQYLYKGTIRDFFPPHHYYPSLRFQYYQEQIPNLKTTDFQEIGKWIPLHELKNHIDFAFLTLHGLKGEDGSIQGLLEWLGIPYSGSGILGSAIGIDKIVQKKLQHSMHYHLLPYLVWNTQESFPVEKVKKEIGFPCVLKNPLQGSSIGTFIAYNEQQLFLGIEKVSLKKQFSLTEWKSYSNEQKIKLLTEWNDLKNGFGFPLWINEQWIFNPEEGLQYLDSCPLERVTIQAIDAPKQILVESYIEGTEFSVIVIQDENGNPIALPPTEIRKKKDVFDYDSKYLPGKANKITPIDLPLEAILKITREAEILMQNFHFNVYARIDGFFTKNTQIYFNDPNTTSGMLPSSFFFHQAAEIGLNPSQFLTYIVYISLITRKNEGRFHLLDSWIDLLQSAFKTEQTQTAQKERIAVILGGYSTERHISVESGRNIVEKLQASGKYQVTPLFLMESESSPHGFELYSLPPRLLFKDNADDIAYSIRKYLQNPSEHPYISYLQNRIQEIQKTFIFSPNFTIKNYDVEKLKEHFDAVFIAIHGRPGEDGQLQKILSSQNLPFNGSQALPAEIAMDKFRCNELLQQNGIQVAPHFLVKKIDYQQNPEQVLTQIEKKLGYPMIGKPNDEGCSSAVKKINNRKELKAYLELTFLEDLSYIEKYRQDLGVLPNEEFPQKSECLLESFITDGSNYHLIEVTVGFLTHWKGNEVIYEVFPPSETIRNSDILTLEEKFLAGQGLNITPARFSKDPSENIRIQKIVQAEIEKAAKIIGLTGYARIDAFVKIYKDGTVEVIIIEANTLPGMTPATCIFHQAALQGYTPLAFIEKILEFAKKII